MTCSCGQPLWAPTSIASGQCEHCRMYGPATGRALPPPKPDEDARTTVDPTEDDDEIGSGARFRKRRSAAAPLPPGPPCVYCGQATHARSQRDAEGRPAHLECTGLYAPSVIDEPVADDDGAALAARVRAVVICEHGHVRLPVWSTGDMNVLPPQRLHMNYRKEDASAESDSSQ